MINYESTPLINMSYGDVLLALVAVLGRVAVGLWGHSGYKAPPMHGDFEAQRHWLEVTTSLPIGEWYKHTKLNDLQYWGLDYPPMTAYVSWAFGKAASYIVPKLVELRSSRGYEQTDGRIFMRASVILCDLLLLLPVLRAVCNEVIHSAARAGRATTPTQRRLLLLTCMIVPGLLLIDHGHFQYNGVCLSLALYGGLLISRDQDILGSVFFCLSLNFKQMSLYYAPVFFCCLLRKCFEQPSMAGKATKFLSLGVTVIAVFGVLWAPFCIYHHPEDTCASSLLQVLHRQFPFSRGIFEDKVANIWYTLSVAVDFRTFLTHSQLLSASLCLTIALLAPTGYFLLTTPVTVVTFLLAMINSALAFFLASFQVHEKSVLLALVPAACLLMEDVAFFTWMQILGCFTMFPLLVKDKLRIPYLACTLGYLAITWLLEVPAPTTGSRRRGGTSLRTLWKTAFRYDGRRTWAEALQSGPLCLLTHNTVKMALIALSSAGMLFLHLLELGMAPPARLPDLYAALFSIFGAANLCYIYAVCVHKMYVAGAEQWSHLMVCEEEVSEVSGGEEVVEPVTVRAGAATRRTAARKSKPE